MTRPGPRPKPVSLKKGPKGFSFSQAELAEKCLMQWYWKYLTPLQFDSGPDAARGVLVHTILEHLCRLPPGERTTAAAMRIAAEQWGPDDPGWLKQDAWVHVTRALRLPEVTDVEVVATEIDFKVDLDGVPFGGKIDRVAHTDHGLSSDDYKDGKRNDHPKSLLGKRRQVMLYAEAWRILNGTRPDDASLIWTASGVVDRHEVTAESVDEAIGWYTRQWERLEKARVSGRFPVKPGPLCSWCPAVAHCPAGIEAVRYRASLPGKSLGDPGRLVLQVAAA